MDELEGLKLVLDAGENASSAAYVYFLVDLLKSIVSMGAFIAFLVVAYKTLSKTISNWSLSQIYAKRWAKQFGYSEHRVGEFPSEKVERIFEEATKDLEKYHENSK